MDFENPAFDSISDGILPSLSRTKSKPNLEGASYFLITTLVGKLSLACRLVGLPSQHMFYITQNLTLPRSVALMSWFTMITLQESTYQISRAPRNSQRVAVPRHKKARLNSEEIRFGPSPTREVSKVPIAVIDHCADTPPLISSEVSKIG